MAQIVFTVSDVFFLYLVSTAAEGHEAIGLPDLF